MSVLFAESQKNEGIRRLLAGIRRIIALRNVM